VPVQFCGIYKVIPGKQPNYNDAYDYATKNKKPLVEVRYQDINEFPIWLVDGQLNPTAMTFYGFKNVSKNPRQKDYSEFKTLCKDLLKIRLYVDQPDTTKPPPQKKPGAKEITNLKAVYGFVAKIYNIYQETISQLDIHFKTFGRAYGAPFDNCALDRKINYGDIRHFHSLYGLKSQQYYLNKLKTNTTLT